MKTEMPQTDATEKLPEHLGSGASRRELVGPHAPPGFESPDKRPQLGAKREFIDRIFVPLGSSCENFTLEINELEFHKCFADPATLPIGNLVGDTHPVWLFFNFLGNKTMFLDGNGGLRFWFLAFDPKLKAWIPVAKSGLECFLHYDSKKLDFQKCGVLFSRAHTEVTMWQLSPLDKIADILPRQLTGHDYCTIAQENVQVAPGFLIPLAREPGVALRDKPRDPGMPHLRTAGLGEPRSELARGEFVPELPRLARLQRGIAAKLCRFLPAFPCRVNIFNPPVRRPEPLIE